MPGHYEDGKKKKKKNQMPNHVGLVQTLGEKSGKSGKNILLDMMKKNLKRHRGK
tara:strand:+ start:338 stop:499 length:162 start_codon:yes stop_codon:yes gene_type:complete